MGVSRSRWSAIGAAVAVTLGAGAVARSDAAPAPDVARSAASFHPISPARIMDTRPGGENVGGFVGPLGADATHTIQVTGAAGVPDGATAVVMNVTVTATSGTSFLTVWPADAARPTASNLNWTAGTTVPNLVTVALSADGKVSFYNHAAATHVIADIAGYYSPAGIKHLDIPINTLALGSLATSAAGSVTLPPTGIPVFGTSFVIPADYTPGTPLTVTIPWNTSASNCSVVLAPSVVTVNRVGRKQIVGPLIQQGEFTVPDPKAGMVSTPSDVRATGAELVTNAATFTLSSPDAAITLQAGDIFAFVVARQGASPQNTCTGATGAISLLALTIDYS